MAITVTADFTSTSIKTAGADLVFTSGNAAIGTYLLLVVALDNTATTDVGTTDVSISDTKGNTYTRLDEFSNGQGSADAGACGGNDDCFSHVKGSD